MNTFEWKYVPNIVSFTVCVGAVCQIWQLKFPLQVFLSLQSAFGVSVRRRGVLLFPEAIVPQSCLL